MMIKSMTGYGLASTSIEGTKYTVEIKSLNSKFLELSLKVPKAFSDKEFTLRNISTKLLERGKVMVSIAVDYNTTITDKVATVNQDLLKSYYHQLKLIAVDLKEKNTNLFQLALNFPEVIQYKMEAVSEEEWEQVYRTFEEAIKDFEKFRIEEGNMLKKDLTLRINNILSGIQLIENNESNRIISVRNRLNQQLEQLINKEYIDYNRFEQELIYYIDKIDITEEKIRLKIHCDYFIQTLNSKEATGKKLGFISQEIGREINTMGAKANDAYLQQLVVGMKEELEKIKEQLLNVL